MIIKEYKPLYADKAEKVCNYLKNKINDNGWIDVGEIYVADMVGDDEPIIIIPTYIEFVDTNYKYDDNDETYIDQLELILTVDIKSEAYNVECISINTGRHIMDDIAYHTDLDTAIRNLNKFISNPVANCKKYGLQVIE